MHRFYMQFSRFTDMTLSLLLSSSNALKYIRSDLAQFLSLLQRILSEHVDLIINVPRVGGACY